MKFITPKRKKSTYEEELNEYVIEIQGEKFLFLKEDTHIKLLIGSFYPYQGGFLYERGLVRLHKIGGIGINDNTQIYRPLEHTGYVGSNAVYDVMEMYNLLASLLKREEALLELRDIKLNQIL